MAGKSDQLQQLLAPTVEALGYQLWGVDYLGQGKHTMLRVYIDSENGISVDDCAKVSEQVSGLLDVEDPVSGEYTLEVSSPGLDRRLFRLEQYPDYVGQLLQVRLKRPFEGKRKMTGQLRGVEDDEVVLGFEDEEVILPFEAIERANVVPEV